MTDERTTYSDSLDFSEQLSYRKHFHRSYGLITMIFASLKHILELNKLSEKEHTITVEKSNASMRERNGRYRDDQRGGLPVCSDKKEGSSVT